MTRGGRGAAHFLPPEARPLEEADFIREGAIPIRLNRGKEKVVWIQARCPSSFTAMEPPALNPWFDDSADPAEASTQAEILEVAGQIEVLCNRLQAAHATLPVSASEALMLLGEAEMDFSTEMRSVIECVVGDRLQPAVGELRAVAAKERK